jgi:hypothetical protein
VPLVVPGEQDTGVVGLSELDGDPGGELEVAVRRDAQQARRIEQGLGAAGVDEQVGAGGGRDGQRRTVGVGLGG